MGALGGHMAHLHESLELTFQELSDILASVANAEVEATEKVDGQNLFLTVDSSGAVRTARNATDLKKGGMTPEEFASKWAGHPAEGAFTKGFEAIKQALDVMGSDVQDLFAGGSRYVNMEVMYPGNPNLIVYDAGSVVLHNFNTFDPTGNPVDDPDATSAFQEFSTALDAAEAQVDGETWTVWGPVAVQLERLASEEPLSEVLAAIQSIAAPVGMDATIEDLAELRLRATAEAGGLPSDRINEVIDAAFDRPGKKKVTAIKKGLPKDQQKLVSQLSTKSNAYTAIAAALRPLELAINDFAIEVLRGMESFFVSNTDTELQRQRSELQGAIKHLQQLASSGDEKVGYLVDKQLEKLKSIEDVASTMEGIVFEYPPGSGELKKLTGTFAMANQLVGAARRKGYAGPDEPETQEESLLRGYVRDLIYEAIEEVAQPETIAIIPGAFKPPHLGHKSMVEHYAAMPGVDRVIVYISDPQKEVSQRAIPGGANITPQMSQAMWQRLIAGIPNVEIAVATQPSPVGVAYDMVLPNTTPFPPGTTVYLGASEKGGDAKRFQYAAAKADPSLIIPDPVENAAPAADLPAEYVSKLEASRYYKEALIPSVKKGKDHAQYSASDMRALLGYACSDPIARDLAGYFVGHENVDMYLTTCQVVSENARLSLARALFGGRF